MNCKNCKKKGCSLTGKNHEMSFECKAYIGITNADRLRAMSMEELTALSRRQEVELVELTGELASKPRWIPVTERLPENHQSVLVLRDDGGIFIFEYFTTSPTDECWIDDHLNVYSAYCVTHWMPLPEPPKEE